ncbi:hypothetical protein EJB05_03936 [Eragrostis curvula]|uniref:Uncharacterized protein n=1 Tax=Eragrostis curvula TaxID=38414 RepID=A0A5J9W938_9POAL|nr:hypothetical protein EJB05_03936 [Eragrostis curvula]
MAVRPGWVVGVARGSAAAWQRVACNPEMLPPDRVLALLCCAPLHLLARLAAFLCVPFIPHARAPLRLALPGRRNRDFLALQRSGLLLHPFVYSDSSSSSSDEDEVGIVIHEHIE